MRFIATHLLLPGCATVLVPRRLFPGLRRVKRFLPALPRAGEKKAKRASPGRGGGEPPHSKAEAADKSAKFYYGGIL